MLCLNVVTIKHEPENLYSIRNVYIVELNNGMKTIIVIIIITINHNASH